MWDLCYWPLKLKQINCQCLTWTHINETISIISLNAWQMTEIISDIRRNADSKHKFVFAYTYISLQWTFWKAPATLKITCVVKILPGWITIKQFLFSRRFNNEKPSAFVFSRELNEIKIRREQRKWRKFQMKISFITWLSEREKFLSNRNTGDLGYVFLGSNFKGTL